MDSTLEIRKRIHEFIDIADERILRIFKGIIDAEEDSELEHSEYPQVPDYIYDRIEEERKKYLSGELKTSSWEEVKERLMKKIMIYHFSLSPNAETDLLEAALWYESQQPGLGEKFAQRVESYFFRIQNNPLHFPLKKGNLREAYIQKFPYVIIYQIIGNNIIVFAVFNTHQNPEKKP
ncbi:type II toxin-antitoxin system RelE/ParE family toxin [Chryseobacterium sp. POE27]|uniref:type II toxin-antitoxin system RelE/ParE family toxin n=1 Tax=Chryseobacterium sp. POE27 TaxID=3138177 RepID=UPI00321B9CF7